MTTQKAATVKTSTTKTATTRKKVVKPTTQSEAQEIKIVDIEETQDLSVAMYGGKTTFFPQSVKIAKDVHTCLSTEQAIKLSGLDWAVMESDICYPHSSRSESGDIVQTLKTIPDHKLIYRNDPSGNDVIFQLANSGYTPVQNTTCFSFFDNVLEDGLATLDTAVSLDDGGIVAITARINGLSADIKKGDQIDSYLVLYNSHNGKLKLGIMFTPIRVICQNTLAYAIKGKKNSSDGSYVSFKHTARIDANLEKIKNAINLNAKNFNSACESYKAMAEKNISIDDYKEYLGRVFESELANHDDISTYRYYGKLLNYYHDGVGSNLSAGTLWGAYQSVTEFLTHDFGVKQNSELNNEKTTATRLNNLLFGKTANLNKNAFVVAEKMTTVL